VTDQEITVPATRAPDAVLVVDREAVVAEAVSIIDVALAKMMQRELVSSGEVADLLLDVRSLLTTKR
jgi:hypothetical protein